MGAAQQADTDESLASQSPNSSPSDVPGLLRSTPTLGKLFEALSIAQGELTDPAKNKTAKVALRAGGDYSYKYSDLADLLKIVRPVFAKHGLCIVQFPINPHRGAVTIITRIGHKSGEYMEGDLTLPVGDEKPQTLGSAITYGRRYSAGGVAGLSPDEDEDGQTAQDAAPDAKKNPRTIQRTDSRQAAQAGAMGAAAASLVSNNSTPPPVIFRMRDSMLQHRLSEILKSKNLDERLWETVAKNMEGLEMAERNYSRAIIEAKKGMPNA